MKILMATMGLDIGGAETHIVELAKALQRMGHRVTIASNGGVYVPEIEAAGIRHIKVPMHTEKEPYWSDDTTFVFYVDISSFDSEAKYVIELQSEGFMTSDYTHLKDSYIIYF